MAWLQVTCLGPGNTKFILSAATSCKSLAIILPQLIFILLHSIDIHVWNFIVWYTFTWGHTWAYALTLSSLIQVHIQFAYRILWITLFQCITTYIWLARHHTDWKEPIASAMCPDTSAELKLPLTDKSRQSPNAICPEKHRNTYGWKFIQTSDLQIVDTKESWIDRPIEVNSSWDNSDLISETNWCVDTLAADWFNVSYNEFVIW